MNGGTASGSETPPTTAHGGTATAGGVQAPALQTATANGGPAEARPLPTATATARIAGREWVWVGVWVLFIMALTCVPYGYALQTAGDRTFGGFLWGVDEGNVYLAWMRQAGTGEVFLRNQYCLAPENPRFFNLFLQVGGRLGALCHWSPAVTFHVLRLLGGAFLLLSFYWLVAQLTANRTARWAALTLASLGSGLGWLVVLKEGLGGLQPVDVGTKWQIQPEALTFPSLLLNGLFTTSMALMCLVFGYALRAVRDHDWGAVWRGGLCLLVLGNIHTYDVFPVWLALGLWMAVSRRLERRLLALMALGLPAMAWALYAAQADPAFLAKGLTPTPAFRFVDYAVGYGLVGALAVVGAVLAGWWSRGKASGGTAGGVQAPALQTAEADGTTASGPVAPPTEATARAEASGSETPPTTASESPPATMGPSVLLLPVAWAVANSLVLLIPVSFQRKMIEGLHLPLCILAGLAVAWLAERLTRGLRARGKLQQARERVVLTLIGVLVCTLPSNAMFLANCMVAAKNNNRELLSVLQPPVYLDKGDDAALKWLRDNAGRDDVILSSSFIGSYLPTYCEGRPWVGHWAETLALTKGGFYLPPTVPLDTWKQVRTGEVEQVSFKSNLGLGQMIYALPDGPGLKHVLDEHPVTMVYYGPNERFLYGPREGDREAFARRWKAAAARALPVVYDRDGVTIYRVAAGAVAGAAPLAP